MSKWPNSVSKKDLRIEFYRGSGPGGQNRNKRDTACRITHLPTGISSSSQEYKSQKQNKSAAWKRLTEQLIPIMKREAVPERYNASTERIRTYSEKQDRVSDSRLPGIVFSYNDVINGNDLEKILSKLQQTK